MQMTEVNSRFWKLADSLFQILSSLKLAVLVILSLAISLGTATVLESLYDTPTAQYWVYHARWFYLVLAGLGINIFCVAVSRIPWKLKHIPFLLAHLGILLLLLGSWITERAAVDGNLRVTEGETTSTVELDQSAVVMSTKDRVFSIPVPWLTPSVTFQPFSTSDRSVPYSLTVDQFISHADPEVSFIPRPVSATSDPNAGLKQAAIRLHIVGGPMKISQDIWLWEGAPQWKDVEAGPARFFLSRKKIEREIQKSNVTKSQPWIGFELRKGGITYTAHSSDGKHVTGMLNVSDSIPEKVAYTGWVIHPGWKGDVTLTVAEWIPDATIQVVYKPARVQYGAQAPSSAIHITGGDASTDVWLGLGDRAVLHLGDQDVGLGYFAKRVILPFSLRLDRFSIEHDPGTLRAASYSSQVTVNGTGAGSGAGVEKKATISMNEPMEMNGYTVYQSSYEDSEPRPVTSVFSVNRDPGRFWKYLGSLLIVLGSVLLFAVKYRSSARPKVKMEVKEVM